MTPNELRSLCNQVGGVYAMARLIGKTPKYLYRRINSEVAISELDVLAITRAVEVVIKSD